MGPMLLYLILAVMKLKKWNKKNYEQTEECPEDCVISKYITASSVVSLFKT